MSGLISYGRFVWKGRVPWFSGPRIVLQNRGARPRKQQNEYRIGAPSLINKCVFPGCWYISKVFKMLFFFKFPSAMFRPSLRSSPLNQTYKIRESSPHTEMQRGFLNIFPTYSKHVPSNLVTGPTICVGARRKGGQEGEVTHCTKNCF